MRIASYRTLLLTGALIAALAAAAHAQSQAAFSSSASLNLLTGAAPATPAPSGSTANPPRHSIDVSAMFVLEDARVAFQSSNSFWMKGGAADASFNLYRGLGAAVEFSGDTAGSVGTGGAATKISLVAGPRYTMQFAPRSSSRIFLQALGGFAHGFNGLYPDSSGVQSSASSGAVEIGGGYDMGLRNGWGIRLIEACWVRTMLPNGASDVQNDLRLSFGITKRFGGAR